MMSARTGGGLALEVPLRTPQADGTVPVVRVPDAGGSGSLPFARAAGPAAGASRAGQHSRGAATLVWQLDEEAPTTLRLQAFSLDGDGEQGQLAALQFSAALLGQVSCLDAAQGTQLAALTADGLLHLVTVPADLQRQPLSRVLAARGAVRSLPLASHFQRLGTPSCVLQLPGRACVGTDQGHILCVSSNLADAGASVELKVGGGGLSLGKMLTGMFGRAGSPAIAQLETLHYRGKEFLCAIHDDSHFRLARRAGRGEGGAAGKWSGPEALQETCQELSSARRAAHPLPLTPSLVPGCGTCRPGGWSIPRSCCPPRSRRSGGPR